MNLVALTEAIIKKIVSDPESVSIKEFDTEEENTIQIEVLISSSDMGKVIGKNGKIINSIRTIVQAASSLEDNKRVKINAVTNGLINIIKYTKNRGKEENKKRI